MRENIRGRLIYTEWRERWMVAKEEGGAGGKKEGLKEGGELCCISSDAEVNGFNIAG